MMKDKNQEISIRGSMQINALILGTDKNQLSQSQISLEFPDNNEHATKDKLKTGSAV